MVKIRILGTSHISPDSLKKVERAIVLLRPDIVAVELDSKRLAALSSGIKGGFSWRDVRRVGIKGWLFALLGAWVERKLGSKVGVSPGAEMLRAVSLAREFDAKVALIDQDIEVTLRRFSGALSWREKGRFLIDLIKGFFGFGVEFDIARVPQQKLIEKLLEEVRVRYPNVYRVLVEERNFFMARQLAILAHKFPESTILAVVGAGHERQIASLLKKYLKPKTANSVKKS
ncbi:TraB/GumN family protein [Candidatus Woesearchaeota archaeon]|nr:TraB/GumN family protein [Candidatus Woesearchaeota archaeon]